MDTITNIPLTKSQLIRQILFYNDYIYMQLSESIDDHWIDELKFYTGYTYGVSRYERLYYAFCKTSCHPLRNGKCTICNVQQIPMWGQYLENLANKLADMPYNYSRLSFNIDTEFYEEPYGMQFHMGKKNVKVTKSDGNTKETNTANLSFFTLKKQGTKPVVEVPPSNDPYEPSDEEENKEKLKQQQTISNVITKEPEIVKTEEKLTNTVSEIDKFQDMRTFLENVEIAKKLKVLVNSGDTNSEELLLTIKKFCAVTIPEQQKAFIEELNDETKNAEQRTEEKIVQQPEQRTEEKIVQQPEQRTEEKIVQKPEQQTEEKIIQQPTTETTTQIPTIEEETASDSSSSYFTSGSEHDLNEAEINMINEGPLAGAKIAVNSALKRIFTSKKVIKRTELAVHAREKIQQEKIKAFKEAGSFNRANRITKGAIDYQNSNFIQDEDNDALSRTSDQSEDNSQLESSLASTNGGVPFNEITGFAELQRQDLLEFKTRGIEVLSIESYNWLITSVTGAKKILTGRTTALYNGINKQLYGYWPYDVITKNSKQMSLYSGVISVDTTLVIHEKIASYVHYIPELKIAPNDYVPITSYRNYFYININFEGKHGYWICLTQSKQGFSNDAILMHVKGMNNNQIRNMIYSLHYIPPIPIVSLVTKTTMSIWMQYAEYTPLVELSTYFKGVAAVERFEPMLPYLFDYKVHRIGFKHDAKSVKSAPDAPLKHRHTQTTFIHNYLCVAAVNIESDIPLAFSYPKPKIEEDETQLNYTGNFMLNLAISDTFKNQYKQPTYTNYNNYYCCTDLQQTYPILLKKGHIPYDIAPKTTIKVCKCTCDVPNLYHMTPELDYCYNCYSLHGSKETPFYHFSYIGAVKQYISYKTTNINWDEWKIWDGPETTWFVLPLFIAFIFGLVSPLLTIFVISFSASIWFHIKTLKNSAYRNLMQLFYIFVAGLIVLVLVIIVHLKFLKKKVSTDDIEKHIDWNKEKSKMLSIKTVITGALTLVGFKTRMLDVSIGIIIATLCLKSELKDDNRIEKIMNLFVENYNEIKPQILSHLKDNKNKYIFGAAIGLIVVIIYYFKTEHDRKLKEHMGKHKQRGTKQEAMVESQQDYDDSIFSVKNVSLKNINTKKLLPDMDSLRNVINTKQAPTKILSKDEILRTVNKDLGTYIGDMMKERFNTFTTDIDKLSNMLSTYPTIALHGAGMKFVLNNPAKQKLFKKRFFDYINGGGKGYLELPNGKLARIFSKPTTKEIEVDLLNTVVDDQEPIHAWEEWGEQLIKNSEFAKTFGLTEHLSTHINHVPQEKLNEHLSLYATDKRCERLKEITQNLNRPIYVTALEQYKLPEAAKFENTRTSYDTLKQQIDRHMLDFSLVESAVYQISQNTSFATAFTTTYDGKTHVFTNAHVIRKFGEEFSVYRNEKFKENFKFTYVCQAADYASGSSLNGAHKSLKTNVDFTAGEVMAVVFRANQIKLLFGYAYTSHGYLTHSIPLVHGDSGSPILDMSGKVVGMHIGALSSILLGVHIKLMLTNQPPPLNIINFKAAQHCGEKPYPQHIIDGMDKVKPDKLYGFKDVIPFIEYEKFGLPTSRDKWGYTQPTLETMFKDFSKYGNRPIVEDEMIPFLEMAAGKIITNLDPYMKHCDTTLISFDQAVAKMKLNTSPGYPWNVYHQTKEETINCKECFDWIKQWVIDVFTGEEVEEPIQHVSNKAEVRSMDKIKQDKVRTFISAPIQYLIIQAMCTVNYCAAFFALPPWVTHSTAGFSQFYGGTQMLYNYMNKFDNHFNTDFSQFDSSQAVVLRTIANEISEKFLEQEYRYVRDRVFQWGTKSLCHFHGYYIWKETGQLSGGYDTLYFNSIISQLLLVTSIYKWMHDNNKPYELLDDLFMYVTQGDDAWFSNDVGFNNDDFARYSKQCGVTINADKSNNNIKIDDVEYLSTKFIKIEFIKGEELILPRFNEDKANFILSFKKNSDNMKYVSKVVALIYLLFPSMFRQEYREHYLKLDSYLNFVIKINKTNVEIQNFAKTIIPIELRLFLFMREEHIYRPELSIYNDIKCEELIFHLGDNNNFITMAGNNKGKKQITTKKVKSEIKREIKKDIKKVHGKPFKTVNNSMKQMVPGLGPMLSQTRRVAVDPQMREAAKIVATLVDPSDYPAKVFVDEYSTEKVVPAVPFEIIEVDWQQSTDSEKESDMLYVVQTKDPLASHIISTNNEDYTKGTLRYRAQIDQGELVSDFSNGNYGPMTVSSNPDNLPELHGSTLYGRKSDKHDGRVYYLMNPNDSFIINASLTVMTGMPAGTVRFTVSEYGERRELQENSFPVTAGGSAAVGFTFSATTLGYYCFTLDSDTSAIFQVATGVWLQINQNTAGDANDIWFGQHPIPYLEQKLASVDALRHKTATTLISYNGQKELGNGTISGVQVKQGKSWYSSTYVGRGALASVNGATTLNASTGLYQFFKPSSPSDYIFREMEYEGYVTGYMETGCDDIMAACYVPSTNLGNARSFRVTITVAIDFKTTDTWFVAHQPKIDAVVIGHVRNILAHYPSVHCNPLHLSDFKNYMKKIGAGVAEWAPKIVNGLAKGVDFAKKYVLPGISAAAMIL